MKKNVLLITNQVRKIPGGVEECYINNLNELGCNVFWAANFSNATVNLENVNCTLINIPICSNPFNIKNIIALKQLKSVIVGHNINVIHCNTPIGGLLGRIAGHSLKVRCVIYKAHGFLFFKNGPKLGFLYKVVEKWFSRYVDTLITINKEDFENARKFKLKNKNSLVKLVHGSGMKLDFEQITNQEKNNIKFNLGIGNNSKVLIAIGELNKNKNVKTIIKAVSLLKEDFCLLICGDGKQRNKLVKLANKYKIADKVKFLGYRNDVLKLIKIADIYLSSSKREGLSRTTSESMAASLPCIVSDVRGLNDLIDSKGGFLFKANDYKMLANKIMHLFNHENVSRDMGSYNREKIKSFTTAIVKKEMKDIYQESFRRAGL